MQIESRQAYTLNKADMTKYESDMSKENNNYLNQFKKQEGESKIAAISVSDFPTEL